jgi:hypothetical protein
MYVSSILLGLKRTIQLVRDTLRLQPVHARRADNVHTTISRLDVRVHDLFCVLAESVDRLPAAFDRSVDESTIESLLSRIYETESLGIDQFAQDHLDRVREHVPLAIHAGSLVVDVGDVRVSHRMGHVLLEFVAEKLSTLERLLRRLALRAQSADGELGAIAGTLLSGYASTVDRYRERTLTQLRLRSDVDLDGLRQTNRRLTATIRPERE